MNANKLVQVSSVIVAFVVYLGLAILGWGGFSMFFADAARVALMIVGLVLVGVSFLTRGNLSAGEEEDRSNRWFFIPVTVIGLAAAFLPAYTERVGFCVFGGETIRWIGVVLSAAGGALRIWPVFVLGRQFSGLVAIQRDHVLVTGGVYRFVRNPSYLGLLISQVGWGLAFRSGVGILLAVFLIPPLIARIRAEEALLRKHFGTEYDVYCARTWRLVPGVY